MMPNTPCLVGASASAMCLGGQASEEDGEAVRTLFDAVGTIFKVRRLVCFAGLTVYHALTRTSCHRSPTFLSSPATRRSPHCLLQGY